MILDVNGYKQLLLKMGCQVACENAVKAAEANLKNLVDTHTKVMLAWHKEVALQRLAVAREWDLALSNLVSSTTGAESCKMWTFNQSSYSLEIFTGIRHGNHPSMPLLVPAWNSKGVLVDLRVEGLVTLYEDEEEGNWRHVPYMNGVDEAVQKAIILAMIHPINHRMVTFR